jgi:hypothetical protein
MTIPSEPVTSVLREPNTAPTERTFQRDLVVQRFVDSIARSSRSMEAKATVSGSIARKVESYAFQTSLIGQLLSLIQQRVPGCLPSCDVSF